MIEAYDRDVDLRGLVGRNAELATTAAAEPTAATAAKATAADALLLTAAATAKATTAATPTAIPAMVNRLRVARRNKFLRTIAILSKGCAV